MYCKSKPLEILKNNTPLGRRKQSIKISLFRLRFSKRLNHFVCNYKNIEYKYLPIDNNAVSDWSKRIDKYIDQ